MNKEGSMMMRTIKRGLSLLLTCAMLSVPDVSLADERPYLFFEQPEQAILHFVQCVAAADFEGALRVTHAQSSAEAYDLKKWIDINFTLMPDVPMSFPSSEYPGYTALNLWGQEQQLKRQLYGMLLSLLVDPALCDYEPRRVTDTGIKINDQTIMPVPDYIAAMNPARLKGLKVELIARWEPSSEIAELKRKSIERRGTIFGYSDEQYFMAVYSFEGKLYGHTYTVLRYPQGWQIEMLCAVLLGASLTGSVEPIDELEVTDWRIPQDIAIVYIAGK